VAHLELLTQTPKPKKKQKIPPNHPSGKHVKTNNKNPSKPPHPQTKIGKIWILKCYIINTCC